MKTLFKLILVLFIMTSLAGNTAMSQNTANTSAEEPFTIYYSSDLIGLADKWVSQLQEKNTDINIQARVLNNNRSYTDLINENAVGIISNNQRRSIESKNLWQFVIARDVVVPVFNTQHPYKESIETLGISPDKLSRANNSAEPFTWANLLDEAKGTPVHFYTLSDNSVISRVSDFMTAGSTTLPMKTVENSEVLFEKINADIYAIGFCRLSDIKKMDSQFSENHLALLPIDKNNNGKLDYVEQIYSGLESLSRGVWIGKYPAELISELYMVTPAHITQQNQQQVVDWILADGQNNLNDFGFTGLLAHEIKSRQIRATEPLVDNQSYSSNHSLLKVILIIIAALVIFGLIADFLYAYMSRKKQSGVTLTLEGTSVAQSGSNLPNGLMFDKTHTWAYLEKNGMVTVGIDDFITSVTGPITGVKLKNVGDLVKKGEVLFTLIQHGKQLNIKAPVTGIITEPNATLFYQPELLNNSPYGLGWVYKIEPAKWIREMQLMLMADNFKTWLNTEYKRLKDFFGIVNSVTGIAVMQDGGEINYAALKGLSPEIWEEFQTNFIDNLS